jgi:hypothetical protein
MSEANYKDQARKFGEAGAALLRASINTIRQNKELHQFERKRAVAKIVNKDLVARGKFVYTITDEMFFLDAGSKSLEHLHDVSFRANLYDRFGLNKTEDETRFVEADLEMLARTRGELCAIHQLSHWDDRERILYVHANDGTMFKLDGHTIEPIDNGRQGVLFRSDRRAEPIAAQLPFDKWSDRTVVYHQLFDGLSLIGDSHRSQALLKTWFLALFFPELLPVRPIVVMVGEKGARKTSAGRRFGIFLYGRQFEVGSFRSDATGEQDFLAAVTARKFLIFDNADARLPWLPDHLAKLSTGAEIERRKLYTTNDLVSYRPDCFLMLTSRTTPWKNGRDDVASRLIPIRMENIKASNLPEATLRRNLLNQRPQIWGAVLTILNDVVATIRKDTGAFVSHHRLADFHWFGHNAAKVLGIPDDFEDAMIALETEQSEFLAEGDDRLDLCRIWLGQTTNIDQEPAFLSTDDLFKQLRQVFTGPDRAFPFRSSTALGTWMSRNKELLFHTLGLTIELEHRREGNGWTFQKGSEGSGLHGFTGYNSADNQAESEREGVKPASREKRSNLEELSKTWKPIKH